MTVEIHRPELEALILERMKTGGFHDVEDVLLRALRISPLAGDQTTRPCEGRAGADLITAIQSSPYREIEIEPTRYRLPVPDVTF
jgi:hypothetical protein